MLQDPRQHVVLVLSYLFVCDIRNFYGDVTLSLPADGLSDHPEAAGPQDPLRLIEARKAYLWRFILLQLVGGTSKQQQLVQALHFEERFECARIIFLIVPHPLNR